MRILGVAYVLIEVLAFILLGNWLGFGWTILLTLALFFAGVGIAGWQMKSLAQRAKNREEAPGALTADAALSAFGAFLVALPGVVTTVVGILFIIPLTRALIRKLLGAAAAAAIMRMGGMTFSVASRVGEPDAENFPGWGQVIDHRTDEFSRGFDQKYGKSGDGDQVR